MVTPVNSTTNGTADLSKAFGTDKALGRDAFLKLLVAQLKNQDPLKPQDNSAFVAELAQFSNLEQAMGVNDRLDAMMLQNQGMQNSNVVAMVGSVATVRGSMVTTDASGVGVPVAFALDRELVHVHRIGDVDRKHQFDVDRDGARAFVGKKIRKPRSGKARRRRERSHRKNDERDQPLHESSLGQRLPRAEGGKKAARR